MDDKAKNDNEMESVILNEENKTVLGMYLDTLSYRTLFSISCSHKRI